jgi:hypothetical protein
VVVAQPRQESRSFGQSNQTHSFIAAKKVRLKVEQYVEDKIRGRYGHSKQRTQRFGDQFHIGHRELKPKH